MAGPRIFVPGPSVRPVFGNPAQYIKGIGDTIEGFDRRRIMDERTAADKLFKEQTTALNERKQDFVESAPERDEALRLQNLERDADKFKTVLNYAEGAQYAGGDRLAESNIDGLLGQDPRYQKLDDAGKLAARNKYILDNPSLMTDPREFAKTLTAGLTQSGKFTGDEIRTAVAQQVAERYPTGDKDLVKAQLRDPKDYLGSGTTNNVTVGSDGRIFSTGGSRGRPKLINDPSSQAQRDEVVDSIASGFAVAEKTGHLPWFLGGGRLEIPGGNLNISKQDIEGMVGIMATEGGIVSPTAMQNVLVPGIALTSKGELKEDYDYRTGPGKQKLIAAAKKAQATEERLLTAGGDISAAGQAAGGRIFSLADATNAANKHNEALLSTLTPQALSDEGIVSSFLDSLGGQTQPGKVAPPSEGGVTTPQADAPILPAAATAAVDPVQAEYLRQAQIDGGSPNAPASLGSTDAPVFDVGGDVPEERVRDNILGLIESATPPTPHAIAGNIFNTVAENAPKVFDTATTAASDLAESLTAPGRSEVTGVDIDERMTPTPGESAEDLSNVDLEDRSAALVEAKKLLQEGKISYDDAGRGTGGTLNDKLLIAYRKYLEGKRK